MVRCVYMCVCLVYDSSTAVDATGYLSGACFVGNGNKAFRVLRCMYVYDIVLVYSTAVGYIHCCAEKNVLQGVGELAYGDASVPDTLE